MYILVKAKPWEAKSFQVYKITNIHDFIYKTYNVEWIDNYKKYKIFLYYEDVRLRLDGT